MVGVAGQCCLHPLLFHWLVRRNLMQVCVVAYVGICICVSGVQMVPAMMVTVSLLQRFSLPLLLPHPAAPVPPSYPASCLPTGWRCDASYGELWRLWAVAWTLWRGRGGARTGRGGAQRKVRPLLLIHLERNLTMNTVVLELLFEHVLSLVDLNTSPLVGQLHLY